MTFTVTPTTGFYISATDANPTDGVPLVINMTNPTPASPAGRVQTAGGAVVNWAPPVGRTWTGATSTNWSVAANWNPQVVPTNTDDVVIPSGPSNMPAVTTSCSAKSLTVNTGATLNLGTFNCTAAGNVFADGAITGTGAIAIATPAQIRGNFPSLILSAKITQAASVTAAGNVTVTGPAGSYVIGGQVLTMGGNLGVQGGARLIMLSPADQVTVTGNAVFSGGFELDSLNAGTLSIGGNLTQNTGSTGDTYHTSGTHQTVFTGNNPTIFFATPGDVPGTSHFQQFAWTGNGTLSLTSDAYAHVSFTTTSTTPVTISGAGHLLQVGNYVAAGSITFNNTRLSLNEPSGGPLALNNATFQGLGATAIQLTVSHPGTGGPFTFDNLTFSVTPTGAGRYLSVTDADGPTPTPLTINVANSTPSSPGGFVTVANGAVVNWPATGNTFTWTGAVSTDWFNAGNWDRGTVPGAIDDVILVPITNQPELSNNAVVNNLTSQSGSILDLKGLVLVANGDVDLAGSIMDGVGGGGVTLTGSGNLVRGTINADVVVAGSYVMNGSFIISGNLSVQGSLDLGGNTAQVGGSFLTINNGVLVMTNSADVLDVTGDAIFTGGSTAGLLRGGRITIGGNFNQIGTNSKQSFAADPGHLTQLSANPVSISFTDPGPTLSHFGDLAESGFGATFNLNSDVTVLGFLSGGDGFGGTMVGTNCPTVLTLTGFSTSGPLNLDCVQLVFDDPAGTNQFGINGVTFANLPTNVTQLTIRHPGLAAGNFTTGFLTFVPLTSGDTGFYILVEDTDAASPFLSVQLPSLGTNVTNGPSFTNSVGGGVVLWP